MHASTTRIAALISIVAFPYLCLAQLAPNYQGNCTDAGCHDGYAKQPVVHSPVAEAVCDACHEPKEGETHQFDFVEEGGDLCLDCHEFDDVEFGHQPMVEGECITCHNPHAGNTQKLLMADSVGELCMECHDELTDDLDFVHGPVAAGACTACHNPHGSDHPSILQRDSANLCSTCHVDKKATEDEKTFLHAPLKDGCDACHGAHGGENKLFLSDSPPDLCLDCHDDISDLLDEAEVTHDAVTEGAACVACHDPHVSKFEKLLLKESMPLCLSCHNEALKSGDGELVDMAQHLKDNPNHHGPVQDSDCATCHNPHGGDRFRLLTNSYPEGFYASYAEEIYELCLDCHDVEAFEEEETDEDTEFRNGEQNLHFLHVNKDPKGRTCRACHDVHGSKKPKHIRESVPFGDWQIPINFQTTENGGSCQPGCHRLYRYDRESVFDNFPNRPSPAPTSKPPAADQPAKPNDAEELPSP